MIMRNLGQFIFLGSVFLIANYGILYYKMKDKEHDTKKEFLLDLIPYYIIINGIRKFFLKCYKFLREYYDTLI